MVDYSAYHWAKKAQYLVESIGHALVYKGSVATYADLPSSGNKIGDMWNVLSDGSNYAWDGTAWDGLSGIVDLSAYRTSADQDVIDAKKLENNSTGTSSLSLLGAATVDSAATCIGVDSTAGTNGTSLGRSANSVNGGLAIGTNSKANGTWSTAIGNGNSLSNTAEATASGAIAIGHDAHATASGAYQIGVGTNSTADSLQVKTYQLLDTSTGLIPDARISSNIAKTSDIKDSTITITQGGVIKGSFTLNQSSGDTIEIDASSGLPSQSGQSGKFLTTDGTDASWVTVDASTVGALPDTTTASDIGGANTDLSNLTSIGKNIGNWSSNVTNCITYIPQDIKLELNSGTLTLKAGSKVYVPNGFESDGTTPKFNEVTIESDLTVTASTSGKTLISVQSDGSGLVARVATKCVSGTTRSLTDTYMLWYNTTNNVINNYGSSSSTVNSTTSLPVAAVVVSGGVISSIDQVFNGFGYIGSTVFALPGVKGLIPNGRNDDGTLNSTEYTVESVLTSTMTTSDTTARDYCITSSGIQRNRQYYLGEDGYLYRGSDGAKESGFVFAYANISSSGITYFAKKQSFNAQDNNEINQICDGGVHNLNVTVVQNVSINGSTNLSYTLSGLPDDGRSYMVLISAVGVTGSTSGNRADIYISSDINVTGVGICRATARTASSWYCAGSTWIAVSSSRKIYLSRSADYTGTASVFLRGYRRIGTNT